MLSAAKSFVSSTHRHLTSMYDRSPSTSVLLKRYARKKYAPLYAFIAVIVLFLLLFAAPLPPQIEQPRQQLIQHVADAAKERFGAHVSPEVAQAKLTEAMKSQLDYDEPRLENVTSRYAYATFMSHDTFLDDDEIEHDNYFTAVRILIYQLLHAEETKTRLDIPIIVMVNKDVSEAKRKRLRRDGAIVWEATPVDGGWVSFWRDEYKSVLSKLRLWELTQFERICFLDGDMVLTKPIDGIFDDPSVAVQTTGVNPHHIQDDEYPLPSTYVFAGMMELTVDHNYPPEQHFVDWPNINYLNAGFFVMQPSLELMEYYLSLFELPDRFDDWLPEQNLWNYAHRREGNMPWIQMAQGWNVHYPKVADVEGGAATLHDHWWDPINEEIGPYMKTWRYRMKGFHEARDQMLAKVGI